MKIAILGGSFNPLHISHAMLADTVARELGYDKVLFIPTCIPPHKEISGGATTEQRLQMVKEFCATFPDGRFELESCEVDRGGVSYTIDTLKFILEKYKGKIEGKPAILMGEENASEFSKWKSPDEIARLSDIIIVPRYQSYKGIDVTEVSNVATGAYKGDFKEEFNKESFGYECKVLPSPILPVSSTEIRSRIKNGRSYQYLVPVPVYEYIEKNNLYR